MHVPWLLSLSLSLAVSSSSLCERSCWARFTLLWYHAQWSQTNHSHFPGSFPHCVSHSFSGHGVVSTAQSEKWKKVIVLLAECLVTFFLPQCSLSSFFLYYSHSLRSWPSPSKWLRNLCQLKSLISLCLIFKGRLFCTHRATGTTRVACVQDFGGSKSIVGFPLCSHSCSSLEQPPDHTRRLTFVQSWSRGQTEGVRQLSNIYCLHTHSRVCTLAGCEDSRHRGKQINERLTIVWLSGSVVIGV